MFKFVAGYRFPFKTQLILFTLTFLIVTPFLWSTLNYSQFNRNIAVDPPPPSSPDERPVLTEFGDFQCPYCATFTERILSRLRKDFIDSGHLNFEYRHYVILGPGSYQAALAAECARDQLAFSPYHDSIFEQFTSQGRGITVNGLKGLAYQHELNIPRFNLCLDSEWHLPRLKRDSELARELGVNATPTLFLDGQRVGWNDYRVLQERIVERLTDVGR